jgi:hypothetical protein
MILNPTRRVSQTLNDNINVERDNLKMTLKTVLIQLVVFNKSRVMAKSKQNKMYTK